MPSPHQPRRDPQVVCDLVNSVPRANRSAARSRCHRCCSAGVYPPRCAYRKLPSYDSARLASLPPAAEHHEFNLFNVKQMVESDSTRRLIGDMFGGANA